MLSYVQLLATLWTVARQAPLSMGFSRQEYWVAISLSGGSSCDSHLVCLISGHLASSLQEEGANTQPPSTQPTRGKGGKESAGTVFE